MGGDERGLERRSFLKTAFAGTIVSLLDFLGLGEELPSDPTAEEVAELSAKWHFWIDPPDEYRFEPEIRMVRRYEYPDYSIEWLMQRNGPQPHHFQRVIKVLPRKVIGKCPAVVIPFYYVEQTIAHEIDDCTRRLPDFEGIKMAADLARRGFVTVAGDSFHENYIVSDAPRTAHVRWIQASERLLRDWPSWHPHGKKVHDCRLLVDLAAEDPRIDANRIGIAGHSLGGQTGFYAGCLDPRVKAIMASDFAFRFDQSVWNILHYYAGKLSAVRADGLENHTLLTLSGAKPFCLLAGFYDDDTSLRAMTLAKGYRPRPTDLVCVNHATGHRPPRWALEEGYRFLERQLKGGAS